MKSGLSVDEFAPHSLRIFGATTPAAGGRISKRVTQREERWKSDAYRCIRKITEDSRSVSRKLVVAREENERQPGEGTAGGRKLKHVHDNSSQTLPRSFGGVECVGDILCSPRQVVAERTLIDASRCDTV